MVTNFVWVARGNALNSVVVVVFVKHFLSIALAMKKEHCYDTGMLDKKKIKEKLEKERDSLLEQMKGMGKFNLETSEWETTPEEIDFPEADENDKADRFEDFEARSSVMKTLEPRLNTILKALKGLGTLHAAVSRSPLFYTKDVGATS